MPIPNITPGIDMRRVAKQSIRKALVRLAYAKPKLRPFLLSWLKVGKVAEAVSLTVSIPVMSFPKEEWEDIESWLEDGTSSTVRCGDDLGVYKTGQLYASPWSDRYFILITDMKRYTKAEDIPTWDDMTKSMKLSVKSAGRKDSKWDYLTYERIDLQKYEVK